ncbi:MAG TPA: DNA replication and repair protein RecF [Candidatus Limnocylindrales bacterium]|nr:DNA replication and repair protein RecF [Candidatus Limnocylindrales bacterium]
MRVHSLTLEDFRGYERAEVALPPGTVAFVGPNGSGKTNLLEAIHLLARGDSPRARDDREMVRWGRPMARVAAEVERAEDRRRVETLLFSPEPGERRRPRRYLLDGSGKRAEDAIGEIAVVAFFPEDVDLLGAPPSTRRRYVDGTIGQVDRRHRADTRAFARVLEQRNALLRALRDEGRPAPAELAFWDAELCRLGAAVSLARERYVDEIRAGFERATALFAAEQPLEIAYLTQAEGETAEERAAAYARLLEAKRERELWQGTSLVGPQREDLAVTGDGRPLPSFASRGEQRSAVLALKLAEAEWLHDRRGEHPVFLLDDVLSELDADRRETLTSALPEGGQALLTAAVRASLTPGIVEGATVIPVAGGTVG